MGNYFGAMEPAVRLQEEGEAFYFIANYHAMTTVQDPEELRANDARSWRSTSWPAGWIRRRRCSSARATCPR